jgi:hypothetical protein
MDEDVNWLHGERIECPQCHQPLYRVDHSPFYDEDFLYCDQCPIHVEVSRYDPAYDQVVRTLPPGHDYATRMRAIEARLKPCSCGGHSAMTRHAAAQSATHPSSCTIPQASTSPCGLT